MEGQTAQEENFSGVAYRLFLLILLKMRQECPFVVVSRVKLRICGHFEVLPFSLENTKWIESEHHV